MEEVFYALNPWWEGKDFNSGIARDEYLSKFNIAFSRRQIEIFIGGRRVGKTTLLKQMVRSALATGITSKEILYLSLDHPRLMRISLSGHIDFFQRFPKTRQMVIVSKDVEKEMSKEGTQIKVVPLWKYLLPVQG